MKISIGYGNYLFDRSSYANINRDTIPSKTVSSNELKCFSPLYFDCLIATILTVTRRTGAFLAIRSNQIYHPYKLCDIIDFNRKFLSEI